MVFWWLTQKHELSLFFFFLDHLLRKPAWTQTDLFRQWISESWQDRKEYHPSDLLSSGMYGKKKKNNNNKPMVLAPGIKLPNTTQFPKERSCSWGKSVTFNWSTFDKTPFLSLQANTISVFREPFEKHISAPGHSLPLPIVKADEFRIIFEGLGWQLQIKVLLI